MGQAAGIRPNISDFLRIAKRQHISHGHVNAWIKSIQSVTKLNRDSDVASGTASQEINFWLTFERALEGIEAELRSDEVNMVMDCLRNAKHFHATVSFIADIGLKDATDQGKSCFKKC
jgi:Dynein heavy chain, N-terminal region 1